MNDAHRELVDEIERRLKGHISAVEGPRNPAVWLRLLLAPLAIVIATWFLQCQADQGLAELRGRLALNQVFYKAQLGKLEEGYRLVSATDHLVSQGVVTPSLERTRALRQGVVRLRRWLAAHEFYLSKRALALGTELTGAGVTVFRDLEQGGKEGVGPARTIWNKRSARLKKALRADARTTEPEEIPR